jgi:hypothetical protein
VIRDITEEKRALEALKESEEAYLHKTILDIFHAYKGEEPKGGNKG